MAGKPLTLACFLAAVIAAGTAASAEPLELSVKPVLCITTPQARTCDVRFLVIWQSTARGDYCLYNDFAAGALDCWVDLDAGRLDEDRSVTRSFAYWMTHPDQAVRLAEVEVKVLSTKSSDRRRNRRKRHVWSIL